MTLLSSLGPETAVITLSVACHAVCMPLSSSAPAGEAAIALKEMRASTLIVPVEGDAVAEDVAGRPEIPTLRLAWDSAGESRCGTWQGPGPSDVALLMRTSGRYRFAVHPLRFTFHWGIDRMKSRYEVRE